MSVSFSRLSRQDVPQFLLRNATRRDAISAWRFRKRAHSLHFVRPMHTCAIRRTGMLPSGVFFVISWDSEGFTCQVAFKSFFHKEAVRRRKLPHQRFEFALGRGGHQDSPHIAPQRAFCNFNNNLKNSASPALYVSSTLFHPGLLTKSPVTNSPQPSAAQPKILPHQRSAFQALDSIRCGLLRPQDFPKNR